MSGRRRRSTSTSARPSFGRRASPISRAAGRSSERSAGSSAPDIRTGSGRAIRDAPGALSDGPGDGHLQPVADDPRGLPRVRYLRGQRRSSTSSMPTERSAGSSTPSTRPTSTIEIVPLTRGWAGCGGRITIEALRYFEDRLRRGLESAGRDRWACDAPAWRLCRGRRRRRRGPAARDLPRGSRAWRADRPDAGPSRQREPGDGRPVRRHRRLSDPPARSASRPPRHRRDCSSASLPAR